MFQGRQGLDIWGTPLSKFHDQHQQKADLAPQLSTVAALVTHRGPTTIVWYIIVWCILAWRIRIWYSMMQA